MADKKLPPVNRAHEELLETEKSYLDDLHALHQLCKAVLAFGAADKRARDAIFLNVADILACNQEFYRLATVAGAVNVRQLAHAFCAQSEDFIRVYRPYLAGYNVALDILNLYMEETRFMEVVRTFIADLGKTELPNLLIKPVQRICKYQLLFEQVVKESSPDDSIELKVLIQDAWQKSLHINQVVNRDLPRDAKHASSVATEDTKKLLRELKKTKSLRDLKSSSNSSISGSGISSSTSTATSPATSPPVSPRSILLTSPTRRSGAGHSTPTRSSRPNSTAMGWDTALSDAKLNAVANSGSGIRPMSVAISEPPAGVDTAGGGTVKRNSKEEKRQRRIKELLRDMQRVTEELDRIRTELAMYTGNSL